MAFCTACGQRLTGGERFCGHCGVQLAVAADAARAPTDAASPVESDPAARPEKPAPAARPEVSGPRWTVGSGPLPLPPRNPAVRRAVITLGLPVVLVAAGLVGALTLFGMLRSDPSPSDAVPKVVTPLSPGTPAPTTGPGGGVTGGAATSPPGATTSTPPRITATTALQQAHAVEDLLDIAARTPVAATVASLARCDPTTLDASAAVTTLQTAAAGRSDLLRRLQDVPVDELPDGPALKAALQETWFQWQTADQQYLTWARGIASGAPCNPQSPFKLAGDVATGAAGRAGTEFVAAWNTKVARPLHLPARRVRDL